MEKEIDPDKRRTCLVRLPGLIAASVLVPSLLLSENARASAGKSIGCFEYSATDESYLERTVSDPHYPETFNGNYRIPRNIFGLKGSLQLEINPSSTIFSVGINHLLDKKYFSVGRIVDGNKVIYFEEKRDLDGSNPGANYSETYPYPSKGKTIIDVLDKIVLGEKAGMRFDFYGKDKAPQEYLIRTIRQPAEHLNYNFRLNAEITGGLPDVEGLTFFFREFEVKKKKKRILTEIWVDYNVKHPDHGRVLLRVPGVLREE